MIDVLLFKSDFDRARAREQKLKDGHVGSACTYWTKSNKDLIGALGEIAFEKYLKFIAADFNAHAEVTGHAGDRYDYVMRAGGRSHFFDVKTSTRYDTIAVNPRQAEKAQRHGARLVAVKLDLNAGRAVIIGHASPSALTRDMAKDFTYNGERVEMYSVPPHRLLRFKVNDCVVS